MTDESRSLRARRSEPCAVSRHGYCTDDNARLLVVTAREPDDRRRGCLESRRARPSSSRASIQTAAVATAWTAPAAGPIEPGHRRLLGSQRLGARRRRGQHDDPDGACHSAQRLRPCRPATITLATSDGVRRTRRRRRRSPSTPVTPLHWPCSVMPSTRSAPSSTGTVVVARATSHLRQCRARRSRDRRRCRARRLDAVLDRGLAMLAWLLDLETPGGHLSVTGVGGRGPAITVRSSTSSRSRPQRWPTPAGAPTSLTGDPRWLARRRCRRWPGSRATTTPASRCATTAPVAASTGCTPDGVNLNQGAESTLALISTMQRARSLAPAP